MKKSNLQKKIDKLPVKKMLLWGFIGGVAGFFALNVIGVVIGVLGGLYLGKNMKK